jgi:hypothetical protein
MKIVNLYQGNCPLNVEKMIRKLLRVVPEENLIGLHSIVIVDTSAQKMHKGAAGAITVEVGTWDLASPSSPLGIGWQLGGFSAAGEGVAGNISGNFSDWLTFFGPSGGVAGGVGASGGVLITGTYYTGMVEFSKLPQKIKDAIQEYLKKKQCP